MTWLEKQLEDPLRVRRIKRWFYVSLGLIVLSEVAWALLHREGAHYSFEEIPPWGSVYGFVSCVAIILVSKAIGKVWLMRPEDYYRS